MNEPSALTVLVTAAVSIGAVHTVIGVDHSLPFIALGRARNWPLRRVLAITTLCGIGHILSSVVLGALGISLGVALERLEWVEATRGSLAAWLLIGFGFLYAAHAFIRAQRRKPHAHAHHHGPGAEHDHVHDHASAEHLHVHEHASGSRATVWALFIVFAFGPCEPLIPLLMAPAAAHHWAWVVLVVLAFGAATLAAMLSVVTIGYLGLARMRLAWAERHADVLAGLAVGCSGLAIQAFGL